MKFWTTLCVAVISIITQSMADADVNVGVRQILAPSKERGVDLDVTVWYPAQAGGEEVLLGDNAFFVGTSAMRDAPISDGKYPLILLSHGAGLAGSAQALSWIATPLAEHGFVVAAPTHPGNTGRNRSAFETMRIWLRPAGLIATFTIETDAFFQNHLDQDKIGVLGLSLGGNTALAIAGARIDPLLLAGYCDTDLLNPSLCGWVRQSGVDLHAMNLESANRDNRDERIRFAMAIDPAPSDIFEVKSFASIRIPVDIINLGQPGKIPGAAQASGIAKAISNARYAVVEDASHYSMFAECKPNASNIIAAEKIDDPLCGDGGGRSRAEIHAQLIDMISKAIEPTLKPDN
ncbi:dienelactone hydrolase [Phyllobacterium brassicacearum]|uniref:Dienelactone hydrolase n=1 Tax=Phyllobacterium brassicacearum TaxID=314235 RepID=A0A2P7BNE8_9HYPH|nr:dienelactone hydrolase [Phyllobacterium brassicacearum]PSH67987.1 dienelactone hydrolase [Phyllobacterium brassicacearum]TDQ28243.1 putative dienelactone hydrolase [Phyllobacterium brassicacearum]